MINKMKATLYGEVNKPVLAFVGSWDPILPEHMQLVNRMVEDAETKGLASLLVILDPAPAAFLMKENPEEWVVYNEPEVRIHNLLNEGLDAVLWIHFRKEYLAYGSAEMFETICNHVNLAEFWFGAKQTFGRGPGGAQPITIRLARERGVRLYRLAELGLLERGGHIRKYLADGSPAVATLHAQYPPIRQRPSCRKLYLPWTPGHYHVLPLYDLSEINTVSSKTDVGIDITLYPDTSTLSHIEWPDPEIQYLMFVAGPQDTVSSIA